MTEFDEKKILLSERARMARPQRAAPSAKGDRWARDV
jgi:hypothetical protein